MAAQVQRAAITHESVSEAPRPYAQAVRIGDYVQVSGQVPLDKDGEIVGIGNIAHQTEQVFDRIEALLSAAGGSLDNVLGMTVFLSALEHYDAMNDVYRARMAKPYPARTTIRADLVRPEFLVEIEALAVIAAQ